jgi:hypothetical protein
MRKISKYLDLFFTPQDVSLIRCHVYNFPITGGYFCRLRTASAMSRLPTLQRCGAMQCSRLTDSTAA